MNKPFKNVVFFNHFHNGDVHISRGLVKKIVEKINLVRPDVTCYYIHKNDPNLLNDIPNLQFRLLSLAEIGEHDNLIYSGDNVYINTWYAQQNHKYLQKHSLTIDCLYFALNDSLKTLFNFSLEDISTDLSVFYPTIDYSKYEINHARSWINNHSQKKIFISNGPVQSGQAINFSIAPIISEVAKNHPDKLFILSNYENCTYLPNMFQSKDIINKMSDCDLNENSFISSHCDIIIGRASGSFTFSLTRENLFDRKIKFLTFCNPSFVIHKGNKFWTDDFFCGQINYTSDFLVFADTDFHIVKSIIENNIND